MKNFDEIALKYAELDEQEKSLKNDKESLKKEIKNYMKSEGMKSVDFEDFVLVYGQQERTSVNEDKMVEKLKALGFDSAIKTVEIPDEQEIQNLIYEEALNPADLDGCINKRTVATLTVKKVKK